MSPWQVLGVEHDIAVADLRRHYAALIKRFRPETHPQDFARIREAYEVALPHARRREAEAEAEAGAGAGSDDAMPHAEETAAAGDGPQAQDAPAPAHEAGAELVAEPGAPAAEEKSAAPPIAVVAAMPDAPAQHDDAPSLAAHFRSFRALAESAAGTDDERFLPALRELLRARAQATLDDSQALEFALVRWFVESDAPPLTLLFEAGRSFDWHAHVEHLSGWLPPWAQRRMEARLALSRDLVYARHFSGSAWLRALHSPRARRPVLVLRPAALEARHWAERWHRGAEDAQAPALQAALDAATLRRLQGFASTDLLAGSAVALLAPDLPTAAVAGAATAAIALAARAALQAILRLPTAHRLRAAARTIMTNKVLAGVATAVAGIIGLAAFADAPVIGVLLLVPACLLGLALLWRVVAWLELVAASPLLWREAVDRLEFARFVRDRAVPDPRRPFGARLGLVQRLRSIPEARRLQAREILTRERPPRARPFQLVRLSRGGGKPSLWRVLWMCAWVVFAVLRLVHAFGR